MVDQSLDSSCLPVEQRMLEICGQYHYGLVMVVTLESIVVANAEICG